MKKISLLALLMLCGCFGSASAPDSYTLDMQKIAPADSHSAATLRVLPPNAESGLEGNAIAVDRGNGQLDVVRNAVWAEPLTKLVQGVFISALQEAHAYRRVIDGDNPSPASLSLRITIERFTLVTAAPAHVEVALHAELLDAGGHVIRTRDLNASVPLQTVRMHTVIPAFEAALSQCINQWLERL